MEEHGRRFFDAEDSTIDLANITNAEQCDESRGYANECTDEQRQPARCRLCATCAYGFKRTSSSSTKCKKCPAPGTNRALIVLGVFIMLLGSAIMVYVGISSESSPEETSDATKKIIFNYLQAISLASSIPLEWTDPVEDMFAMYAAASSAGSSLLIPDCELSHLRTAEAFYLKQIAFTFLVPFVILVCIVSWALIYAGPRFCCRRCKCGPVRCAALRVLSLNRIKTFCILSVTLGLFILYPMLVRQTFSMLKCLSVGQEGRFLMADLQERCFGPRHLQYFLALTVPQLILYVFGLPCFGVFLVLRNRDHLHTTQFRWRYGLLYLGYRRGREWWELVVTLRKVFVVAIGTFGTIFVNSVHMQAYLALLVVFVSIVLHLGMEPFDTTHAPSLELHNLEFASLTVTWCTFFAGLLFFQSEYDSSSVSNGNLVFLTVLLVGGNAIFSVVAAVLYVRAYCRDRRTVIRRHTLFEAARRKGGHQAGTAIVPMGGKGSIDASKSKATQALAQADSDTDDDDTDNGVKYHHVPSATRVGHTRSTVRTVHRLHEEHKIYEERLAEVHKAKQRRSKRRTELRLIARRQLIQSRALCKLDAFAALPAAVIEEVIEEMSFSNYPKGTTIVRQGEIADRFFVLTKGEASAWVTRAQRAENANVGVDMEGSESLVKVGTLEAIACFGESALLGHQGIVQAAAPPSPSPPTRSATVVVESESASLLILDAGHFSSVIESMGQSKDLVMAKVKALADARAAMTAQKNQEGASS
jgi:CRP-like cAMP-binding protein